MPIFEFQRLREIKERYRCYDRRTSQVNRSQDKQDIRFLLDTIADRDNTIKALRNSHPDTSEHRLRPVCQIPGCGCTGKAHA
jgi:hypothetical protein